MPSASSKADNKASPEAPDAIKQALIVIEKKIRNLEKRKAKLDVYREKKRRGEELNEDQKDAVQKYDAVVLNLEFSRELTKQFQQINVDNEKMLKKQAKREKIERQTADIKRNKEILYLQSTLDGMGAENVREDFLAGNNGAVSLQEDNLNQLDELYKLISPTRDQEKNFEGEVAGAAEHLHNYLEAKDKEVAGTTYKDLKALVDKIQECGYFDRQQAAPAAAEPEEEAEETPSVADEEEAPEEEEPTQPEQEEEEPEIPEPEPQPIHEQEPTTDIVSSVQGTFNFLQESQINEHTGQTIEQSPQHMDPAVVAAQPMPPSLSQSQQESQLSFTTGSSLLNSDDMSQLTPSQDQTSQQSAPTTQHHTAQQPTSQPQPSLDSYQAGSTDYSTNFMSTAAVSQPSHNAYAEQTQSLAAQISSHNTMDQQIGDVPPAIPMPNQHVDSMSSGLAQDSQEKKPFTMNPNAAMFQPYPEQQPNQPMSNNYQDTDKSQDYQSGGFGQQQGYGGRGGNRGGRGGRGGRGMSNGYSRGRGGNGGGYNNGNRGGYGGGNRGNSGNRNYQGYPPRSDYRPDGYQGYSNGFSSSGQRGGPRGGGGNMRGGRGGGFGRPNNQAMQQAAA